MLGHWVCYCSYLRADKSWEQPSQYYENSFDLATLWKGLRNDLRSANHTFITTAINEDHRHTKKNITPELPSIQAEDLQQLLKTASLKFLSCSKSLRLKLSLKLKYFPFHRIHASNCQNHLWQCSTLLNNPSISWCNL